MSFYDLFFYFTIYAVLGWCLEVVYALVDTGKFINRGFLTGPGCPIYGFGCIIVILCLSPFSQSLFLLFAGSIILTSILELLTGIVLEKIFHNKWWDYSNEKFNVKGFICLKFSLAWGIACVGVIKVIHPSVEKIVGMIPQNAGYILMALIVITFILDISMTIKSIAKLKKALREIIEIADKIKEKVGTVISAEAMELREKYYALKEQAIFSKSRILKAFPDLTASLPDVKAFAKRLELKVKGPLKRK